MSTSSHLLAYDLSNLAYISAHSLPKGFELKPDGADILVTQLESYIKYLYRQLNPDKVIFACDGLNYWRREIYPEYKGHRQLTELKRCVKDAISIFKAEKENLCCEVEGCEADDVIYALSQTVTGNMTIVSMDQDFHQLITSTVRLYNPRSKKFAKADPNVAFELFVKCFRGDRSDNIPSAYPRISRKKLWQAFNKDDQMQLILGTELTPGNPVAKQYELNRELIDLSNLPVKLFEQLETKLAVLP